MKRRIIIRFFLFFIGWFVALTLLQNNFEIRGRGPLSWQEIYDDLHIFLVVSCWSAILCTFSYFVNKHDKKGKA